MIAELCLLCSLSMWAMESNEEVLAILKALRIFILIYGKLVVESDSLNAIS